MLLLAASLRHMLWNYAPNLRNRWHTCAHDGSRAFCGLTVVSQTALPNCCQPSNAQRQVEGCRPRWLTYH
ncbi:MAG: hypothetical protein ACJ0BJ_00260 [Pirellulales bacterium]